MTDLTISPPAVLTGAQRPRVFSPAADAVSSAGKEAVELAAMAGLVLDPWQEFVLEHSLAERADGKWAASRVGLVVPRQNGKGALLEARELAGLFLLGERLIIHSAHQFDTSLEAFNRLLALIEDTPDLDKRVKRVSRSHGDEGIYMIGGQRIRFRTRTKGGGRGFTSDCLILDEAMVLPEAMLAALLPTLSARPNPQVWYTGSAVDQNVHEDGLVLTRIRQSGHANDNPRLAYFEWSVAESNPDDVEPHVAADEKVWAAANPGLGIRIAAETIVDERADLDARSFAVERLGVGDWPNLDGANTVLDPVKWAALTDADSEPVDPVFFAFDVSPDRSWSSISVAGRRADGLLHVETTDRRRGTGWVVPRIVDLCAAHKPSGVVCDATGPAGSLLHELEQQQMGVALTSVTAREHAQACGTLFDAVDQATVRHLGTPELISAVRGAVSRPLGEAWAWSRKNSAVDITPLVAATLALWGVVSTVEAKPWVGW